MTARPDASDLAGALAEAEAALLAAVLDRPQRLASVRWLRPDHLDGDLAAWTLDSLRGGASPSAILAAAAPEEAAWLAGLPIISDDVRHYAVIILRLGAAELRRHGRALLAEAAERERLAAWTERREGRRYAA